MRFQVVQRVALSVVVSAIALLVPSLPAQAEQGQGQQAHQNREKKKQKQEEQQQAKKEKQQAKQEQRQQQRQAQQEQRHARAQQQVQRNETARAQRDAQQAQAHAQRQAHQAQREAQRAEQVDARQRHEQLQQQSRQQDIQQDQARARNQERLSQESQRVLVEQQRVRSERYSRQFVQEEPVARQRATQLQSQRRSAQYRYQQRYVDGLQQQRRDIGDWQSYDYDRDPYFYSAPTHRYSYAGRSYTTNQYGADYVRLAVNNGYEEGFYAGQADREDRWTRGTYRDSYGYQDANYGYNGRYIDQSQYNHYFREGFRRGYDDGRNSRSRYGRSSGRGHQLLASVMIQIVNIRSIR
jgi:chemotaxis protein histidine kinase CheA